MRTSRLPLVLAMVCLAVLPASALGAFPGVSGRIAFDRYVSSSGHDQIFTVASDGSTPLQLTSDPNLSACTPSFSRDGKLIAFQLGVDCGTAGAVAVMNADGSNQHVVATPSPGFTYGQPTFSPDGKRLVFERDDASGGELLFVVNVDGTGIHQLETPPVNSADETPRWSPDGTKIAFMREPVDDSGGQIMIINADGTGSVTPVSTPPPNYKDGDPNFSPDGSKIVFGRSQATELGVPTNVIVVDVNTRVQTPLTTDTADTLENEAPAFSPDGKQIVYGHSDDTASTGQLYVMNADGSAKHSITPPVANQMDVEPDWQPIPVKHTVSVSKSGSGLGTVTSSPPGVSCGSSCSARFDAGQVVTLTATPASGSTFAGWSGTGCTGTGTCTLAVNLDRSLIATFSANAPPLLSAFKVSPSRVSIAGRRVHGKCVKPTKNRHLAPCRLSVTLSASYNLSRASSVAFKLTRLVTGRKVKGKCVKQAKQNHQNKRCTLANPVNVSIAGPGAAGANRFTLDARSLGPGSFVITATPQAGRSRSVRFTIVS